MATDVNNVPTGTLPEIWGQGTIGMRSIRQLWLTNANLSGSLPPVWATQMASMWEVDFVQCGLTGELWGSAAEGSGNIT